MKILYVNDALAIWGGIERSLTLQMNLLAERYGNEIRLVTVNQGNHSYPYGLHPSISHIDLGVGLHHKYRYRGIRRLWKAAVTECRYITRLRHQIKLWQPDVVVLMRYEQWEVYFAIGNTSLVVESHSMCRADTFDNLTLWQRLRLSFSKVLARKAQKVVALTEGDANDWRRYNPHVCVIPNVVILNDKLPYSSLTSRSAIFVGRLCFQKGIDSLIEIWKKVHGRHPDWHLNIYGEGELKEHYLSDISIQAINIHVYEPTHDIMERYKENSVLLLTSVFEPFGLVLPEAMSCGLPVVAFDCPYGPSDIISDGVDGFLVKDRDVDAFADKVCLLIENEALRRQMGQKGIASAQRYRAEAIMPIWERYVFTC